MVLTIRPYEHHATLTDSFEGDIMHKIDLYLAKGLFIGGLTRSFASYGGLNTQEN